jgi:hypothetical protein
MGPSPKGLGHSARDYKVGTRKRGKDKKMWVVKTTKLSSGKRYKRWCRVAKPVLKKQKTTKRKAGRTNTKPKTKRSKRTTRKLRGGLQPDPNGDPRGPQGQGHDIYDFSQGPHMPQGQGQAHITPNQQGQTSVPGEPAEDEQGRITSEVPSQGSSDQQS